MRNRIIDPFEKLIISLYTYSPICRREDYYPMYYLNKPIDKMLNTDKNKIYILSDRCFIFNMYNTYSTYRQQTFKCPNEIYQHIINLTYQDQKNNEQHYRNGYRLFLNITDTNTFSKFVSKIFKNCW